MSKMIERVARAICAKTNIAMEGEIVYDNPDRMVTRAVRAGHKGYLDPFPAWMLYVDRAKAAIEAMREPDDWMMKACRFYGGFEGMDVWVAMIDAALDGAPREG